MLVAGVKLRNTVLCFFAILAEKLPGDLDGLILVVDPDDLDVRWRLLVSGMPYRLQLLEAVRVQHDAAPDGPAADFALHSSSPSSAVSFASAGKDAWRTIPPSMVSDSEIAPLTMLEERRQSLSSTVRSAPY